MGCWCSAISTLLEKNINKERLVMLITLVGITAFELLFEARARYIYVPIYIIVFEYGLKYKKSKKAKK